MARTTKEDIRGWLELGKAKGATHLLVVCDTYDYDDYPVYVMPGQDVHEIAKSKNGPNMTKLMEVYNLAIDMEEQLAQYRSFNY